MAPSDWRPTELPDLGPDPERIYALVDRLVDLAGDEEACRLLGVDGVLEGQLDLAFLEDPLDWLAADIARAIEAADTGDAGAGEDGALSLDLLVAELRLCRLIGGSVTPRDLAERVMGVINESRGLP